MSFEDMEKGLQQKHQRVDYLLEVIKNAREKVPQNQRSAEKIRDTIAETEQKLVAEVGEDEFKRLTGREYLKEDL